MDTEPNLRWSADRPGCRFRRENFVCGRGGSGSYWTGGYYATDDLPGRVWAAIRSEAERCDRLQGFQIVHSIGGGTGSGLGARVAEHLRAEYPGRTVNTYSTYGVATGIGEPFNAALCAARLIGTSHNTYLTMAAELADLDYQASLTMSGTTAGLRFAGQVNSDMAKRTNDLVPYERLHFFAPQFAPRTHRGQFEHEVREGTDDSACLRLASRLFAATAPSCADGRPPCVVMAALITFRGSHLECNGQRDVLSRRVVAAAGVQQQRFLFPNNVKTTVCSVPSCGIQLSGTLMANTTAMWDMFDRVRRRCVFALAKRDQMHVFDAEGMSSDDFYYALEEINSLIEEYRSVEGTIDDTTATVSSSVI